MKTVFRKLNVNWNAEPNAPDPLIKVNGNDLVVEFYLNAFQFEQYEEEDKGILVFRNCWRYRMGTVNDGNCLASAAAA